MSTLDSGLLLRNQNFFSNIFNISEWYAYERFGYEVTKSLTRMRSRVEREKGNFEKRVVIAGVLCYLMPIDNG